MKKVLKFSASWCGPCKTLSKTIEGGGDLGVTITEIDVDEQLSLAAEHNIKSVPTLIMFDGDVEVKRKSGAMNLQQLKEFLA